MTTETETYLVSAAETLELQKSDDALVIDVRDEDDYKKSHITGAVNIPQIFYHLSTTTDEELLEAKTIFEELFCRAGVTSDTLVILYEDGMASRFGGSFRGWWWLNYFGHEKVAVLDGGFRSWEEEKLPTDDKPVPRTRSDFQSRDQRKHAGS